MRAPEGPSIVPPIGSALMGRRFTAETILAGLAAQGVTVFSVREFRRDWRLSLPQADVWMARFIRAGAVRRFRGRWYVLEGPAGRSALREPMYLGTRVVGDSYVGFGSALHLHGWTDRAPRTTLLASLRHNHIRSIAGHPVRVVTLPPWRHFGSALVRRGGLEFPAADPEKAIVDAFYQPRHCGGMEAVLAALRRAHGALDVTRLETYAIRMDDRSLCSRLGHALEELGEAPRFLRRYDAEIPTRLDPQGPLKGRLDRRWHVVVNLGAAARR